MKTIKRRGIALATMLVLMTLVLLLWSGVTRCGKIHAAAHAGDVEKVKNLLAGNPGLVNARGILLGGTPLHVAARRGKKDVAELLLANGADVNARDKMGKTPLHDAARHNSKDVAELLLAKGADVNARDKRGRTPLHLAARYNSKDVAELLLANKADVNAKNNNGETSLHVAAIKNNKNMVEFLLANGADVNARDRLGGWTPLHEAVFWGKKDVAELLRQHGGVK
jgi:ankyrin repeat protein